MKIIERTKFENKVYGPEINGLRSVMNGSHYVRGIRGMAIISEVFQTLQMNQFASQRYENGFNEANEIVKKISAMITKSKSKSAITEWESLNIMMKSSEFEVFQTSGNKANYSNFLWKIPAVNHEDKCSLHHEFSEKLSQTDQTYIQWLVGYISNRGNPFDPENTTMKNLVTGATLDAESMSFLLGSVAKGKEAYDNFVKERLGCKSVKLFDKIPMTWKTKKMGKNWKPPNVNKETIHFLRMIDYSRLCNLDIAKHEIVLTSFYLTKDGKLQKSPKSELARELKNLLEKPCPIEIPYSDLKSVVVIDFMVYVQKIPTKKMMLATYENFFKALWRTFSSLSKGCSQIDIDFDVYLRHSIKQGERNQKSKLDLIETNITSVKQQLPIEMDRFWLSSKKQWNSNNHLSSGHVTIVFQKFLSI